MKPLKRIVYCVLYFMLSFTFLFVGFVNIVVWICTGENIAAGFFSKDYNKLFTNFLKL